MKILHTKLREKGVILKMEYNAFKEAVISAARASGIAEYELYYNAGEDVSVDVFKHEINEFSSSADGGVCFRCVVDGKMGYASTEELSEEQAISLVARAVDNAGTLETEEREYLAAGGLEYETLDLKPYALPTTEELINTALKGERAVYDADPAVIDGSSAGAACGSVKIAICNSNGLDLSYENNMATFYAQSVVSNGKEMSDGFEVNVGSFDKLDVGELAKKATDEALSMLDADVAPTGAYPVVFAPDAMSSLLATFSGIFSAENAQRGLSRLGGKEGEVVASDIVTLVDDPFHPESAMPINFDGEGSPTHKKNVIENGTFKTLLYNLKTAATAGVQTTGNAARSYNSTVGIRPFSMYIAPGDKTEDQILEEVGEGVYITSLGGLHAGANVVSGDFSLQSSGHMIEGGKKGRAVKSFTVAGNFYALLGGITAIGSELKLRSRGITSFSSPCVRVDGLTVAGK